MSSLLKALLGILLMAGSSQAAYLLEVDTDGMDDGVATFHRDSVLAATQQRPAKVRRAPRLE